ncbi:sodium/potassium-transporting ATPase subunit beta-2-like isoform X4 [Bradysia coprophila]|uniref:sodium/potassium-transporting ATPase subunit beta-2-like isoform X4 n=1 Tax=Bradysia coprophila TaxID=38358 RepID=UPI00187DC2D7|nr:sodium/potassium-transporting ATPase subunit beta-2-like isoform X4 [Bradysia coprophila]
MLNCGRTALFCLFFVFTIQHCAGFWDFWPFNINKETTPSVKVIPETDGNFIHIKHFDESSLQVYIDSMNRFLEPYIKPIHGENLYICDFNNPPPEGRVCHFDRKSLDYCTPENDYSVRRDSPCLLFTLSQVLNWTPTVFNRSDIQDNTNSFSTIPAKVNQSITLAERENSIEKYIWFTCEGDTAADKEFLGPVNYYPQNGFPTYYFPFNNVDGYLSPIVGVHFARPVRGVVITIICKAWAKNIPLDEEKGLGYAKIHLLID